MKSHVNDDVSKDYGWTRHCKNLFWCIALPSRTFWTFSGIRVPVDLFVPFLLLFSFSMRLVLGASHHRHQHHHHRYHHHHYHHQIMPIRTFKTGINDSYKMVNLFLLTYISYCVVAVSCHTTCVYKRYIAVRTIERKQISQCTFCGSLIIQDGGMIPSAWTPSKHGSSICCIMKQLTLLW